MDMGIGFISAVELCTDAMKEFDANILAVVVFGRFVLIGMGRVVKSFFDATLLPHSELTDAIQSSILSDESLKCWGLAN